MIPGSYVSQYGTREKIAREIYSGGRLDCDKAIEYVRECDTNERLQTILEALESMGEMFPQMDITSIDDSMEYLDDVDYNIVNMVQEFVMTDIAGVQSPSPIDYYELLPFQVDGNIMYSILPIDKSGLIIELRAYRDDPDYVGHRERMAYHGYGDRLKFYGRATIDRAQRIINDYIDTHHVHFYDLYRLTQDVITKCFPNLWD